MRITPPFATLLLVMLAALALAFYAWPLRPIGHDDSTRTTAPPAARRKPPASVNAGIFPWREVHSFAEARAMLRDAYRLAPDARFVAAVAEVPRLAGVPVSGEGN